MKSSTIINERKLRRMIRESIREMIGYHGTGSDFTKFDLRFAKTGTGMMDYGYGVYVSENGIVSSKYGSKYLLKVEIPDDNGSNYLYWDKVVSSRKVLYIANKVCDELINNPEYEGMYSESDRENILRDYGFYSSQIDGKNLYCTIELMFGHDDKLASEFLYRLGYTGIKVPIEDCTIDGNKISGYNYVIFNPDDVKIINKENI